MQETIEVSILSEEIFLRPLEVSDIQKEYVSWFNNNDGHLDYFTGSGRVFSKDIIVEDFIKGRDTLSWFYYLITNMHGDFIGNVRIGPIDPVNKTSDLVCLVGNRRFLGAGIGSKAILYNRPLLMPKLYRLRHLHLHLQKFRLFEEHVVRKAYLHTP